MILIESSDAQKGFGEMRFVSFLLATAAVVVSRLFDLPISACQELVFVDAIDSCLLLGLMLLFPGSSEFAPPSTTKS